MKTAKTPKVLLVLPLAFQDGLDKYFGIMRFLRESDLAWEIRLDRMTLSPDNRYSYRFADFDGIIADGPTNDKDAALLVRSALPLVAIDWGDRSTLARRRQTVSIVSDSAAIGRNAADAFLKVGQYASFAFMPTEKATNWASERHAAFAKRLSRHGHEVIALQPGPSLRVQLRKLPKPAAVFCANDIAAAELVDCARDLQMNIPLDLSVLGVDNEQIICANTIPPLASIQPDFKSAGYLAARALKSILDGKTPPRNQLYPINGIVQRKSLGTPRGDGRLVERACHLIENTDLQELRGISGIAAQLGISRRTLDKCFRQIKGCSVLDFIQRRRLREMQLLLSSSNLSVAQICAQCFPSGGTHPMRIFKRETGMTMLQYRFRHPNIQSLFPHDQRRAAGERHL